MYLFIFLMLVYIIVKGYSYTEEFIERVIRDVITTFKLEGSDFFAKKFKYTFLTFKI